MRLRGFCSCSCLTALPGPAWVLISKIYQPFSSSLYSFSKRNLLLYTPEKYLSSKDLPRISRVLPSSERGCVRQQNFSSMAKGYSTLCLRLARTAASFCAYTFPEGRTFSKQSNFVRNAHLLYIVRILGIRRGHANTVLRIPLFAIVCCTGFLSQESAKLCVFRIKRHRKAHNLALP